MTDLFSASFKRYSVNTDLDAFVLHEAAKLQQLYSRMRASGRSTLSSAVSVLLRPTCQSCETQMLARQGLKVVKAGLPCLNTSLRCDAAVQVSCGFLADQACSYDLLAYTLDLTL